MKKILSVFLAVLMCALPFAGNMTVMAADVDATYTFGNAEGYAGEEITVDIKLVVDTQFNTIGFAGLEYDENSLTFVKCTINKELSDMCALRQFDKNKMTLVAALKKQDDDGEPIPAPTEFDGLVCTLTFKINEDAPVGSTNITISDPQVKMDSVLIPAEVESGTITVLGLDFTGLSFKDKAVTYDSNVHKLEVAGVPEFATVEYTVDGDEFTGAEDAGTYEVTATVTAPGYNKETLKAALTINPAQVTVNAVVADKVYDGTDAVTGLAGMPTIDGYIEGDDLNIKDESFATIRFADSKVGSHEILHELEIVGADKDNYEYTINVPKASITKKPITITVNDVNLKVGDVLPSEYTYTVTPELGAEYAPLVGTVKADSKANTNSAKSYTITATFTKTNNPNYDITIQNGTLDVKDKTPQDVYVASIEDKVYGDAPFKITYGVGDNTQFVSDEPWIFTAESNNISVNGTTVTILGAGTAKINASKKGNSVLADFEETVTFTVAKKDVTVTADYKTATKGGALPELTCTVEGLVNGDELTVTLTTTARNTNTVKDYPITVKVAANANYNVTTVNGVLFVRDKKPQNITVTSNLPSDLTYGDEGFKIDVAYGATVTEAETTFVSSDDEVVKVDAEGNVTVIGAGEATITVSKAGNDTIADFAEEIDVVVAKKSVTITAKDASKKVGAVDPALGYDFDESQLVGDDTISGNVAREEGEEVGTYVIGPGTLSLTNSANYDVNFIGGKFEIFDKTPQGIDVATVGAKTYGDAPFALEVTEGANVSTAETTYATDNEAVATVDAEGNVTIVGAGTAKITVAKAGNEDLADFSKTVTVTVAKKAIKVTANAKEKYVGEETPELTYTVEGELVGDDAFTGELAVNDLDKAGGKYDIKIGTLALGDNYKLTYVGAKLSVLKKLDQEIELVALENATYGDEGLVLDVTYGDYNEDAEVVFASANESVATVDADGNITIIGAGTAKISVSVEGNYKYNAFSDEVTLTVAKKSVKVTAVNQTKKVGTADPELTYTTDVELVEGDAFTGALEREAGEELGTYDIKQGTLALDDNYKLTFVKGTFTIVDKNPQTVDVAGVPEEGLVYGGEGFTVTATSAEVADAVVTYESSDESVIAVDENGVATVGNAGEATITVTVAGNDDYAETVVIKTVVVAPKEIVIEELDVVNKTVVFDGIVAADEVSVDFNKLTFVPEDVEEGQTPANYVVSGLELTGDRSANYTLATETVLVPISDEVELVTVTVTYENGTVEGAGSYLAGSEVTLKAVADKNYKFAGWYVGEEKVSSDAEYTFTADEDFAPVAKFTKKSTGGGGGGVSTPTRIVYFELGDDTTNKVVVNKGSKVARPEDPIREGFKFEGWYTDAEFTAEFDFDTVIEDSVTVYAKWTEVEKQPDEDDKKEEEKDDSADWKNPYSDVDEDDWFYAYVKDATVAGIMNGVSEDKFAPDMKVTRAMLVTMLYRAEGEPTAVSDAKFEDIDQKAYYADAVAWAAENGIVTGYSDTEFAPDKNVTREQIATILFRYAAHKGLEAVDLSENLAFKDADKISGYAVAPMNWLVGNEIITGYSDGTVKPQGEASRAEVAAMTARILGIFAK